MDSKNEIEDMKKIVLSFLLALVTVSGAFAQGKQKYSVLYVGGSSNYDSMNSDPSDSLKHAKDAKVRAADFVKFLKARFTTVKYVDGKDYKQSMSDNYDVTVLDGRPAELFPRVLEGNKYMQAQYFTEDFDRPVVSIAEMADRCLNSIGSKCDWFCMCLDFDAHHWDANHAIFKGPWKVQPKAYKAKTYPSALEYGPMYGYSVPDSIMQFTIDGKKFQNRKGHRIGVVARPWGFTDSPETEVISSGVCSKSIDAIAIGRHANVFHWGFAAMPSEMTPAGQALFANTVAYMAKRGPEHMIARKLHEGISTREQAIASKYLISKEAFEDEQKSIEEFVAAYAKGKAEYQAKLAKGEKLSAMEMEIANVDLDDVRRSNSVTFPQFMKQQGGKLFHFFGYNEALYKQYFTDNYNYFYCPDPFGYDLDVDEDARDLGIANNDVRLIDEAIKMMEQNEEAFKNEPKNAYRQSPAAAAYSAGKRILDRYTLVRFESANEYRTWFNTYRDKMFFTESGGWLWLINTQDSSVPGNDYKVRPEFREHLDRTWKPEAVDAPAAKVAPAKKSATTKDNPVAITARYDAAKHEIVIGQDIHEGFHTYAELGPDDPFILVEVNITLNGGEKVGDLKTPVKSPFAGGAGKVYEGYGEFRQEVKGTGEAVITFKYQACDASICLMPQTKTLKVKF